MLLLEQYRIYTQTDGEANWLIVITDRTSSVLTPFTIIHRILYMFMEILKECTRFNQAQWNNYLL